jgi:hypothetical protein
MSDVILKLSEDEALVLFEFFARYEETERLFFVHYAEYIALMKLAGQLDKSTSAIFKANYFELLDMSREKIAEGFESDFPTLEIEERK